MLCDFFVEGKWISITVEQLVFSEYSSFVTRFGSNNLEYDGDWVSFSLAIMECNEFKSSVRCIQSFLSVIANVSELFFLPPNCISRFTFFGMGRALLEDASFSLRDFLPSCSSRRQRFLIRLESDYFCTVSEKEALWASVHATPKSSGQQPRSSSGKFVKPTTFSAKSSGSVSFETSKIACLVLSAPTLSVSRSVIDVPFLPADNSGGTKTLVVRKNPKGKQTFHCIHLTFLSSLLFCIV